MLTRNHRFHGHASLRYVYQHGQTVRVPDLVIRYVVNGRRQTFRAAVVVSKKVNKSAVKRNRIRRRLYALLRELSPGVKLPYDVVLIVQQERLVELPATKLRLVVETGLRTAKVIDTTDNSSATPKKRGTI